MPGFGDFAKKQKKKQSKEEMERKMNKSSFSSYTVPQPEVVGRKKKDNNW